MISLYDCILEFLAFCDLRQHPDTKLNTQSPFLASLDLLHRILEDKRIVEILETIPSSIVE